MNDENLKPFKKGLDPRRNVKGRPVLLPKIDELIATVLSEEKDGLSAAKAILEALRHKAVKGDIRAAEVLLERAYGKPKEKIEQVLTINWEENKAYESESKTD